MKMKRMKTCYTYLGNFVPFLLENEQRIKNMLTEYRSQIRKEKLPDGKEVNSLIFNKDNVVITFSPFRLDYEYLYTDKQEVQIGLESSVKFFKLFGEIFYDFKAARAAVVTTMVLDNKNGNAAKLLANEFKLNSLFGECPEFLMRINNVKNSFEQINSVLDIKPAEIKNQKTNEKVPVMVIIIDVNTMKQNIDYRFEPSDADRVFADLLFEEEEKINILNNL